LIFPKVASHAWVKGQITYSDLTNRSYSIHSLFIRHYTADGTRLFPRQSSISSPITESTRILCPFANMSKTMRPGLLLHPRLRSDLDPSERDSEPDTFSEISRKSRRKWKRTLPFKERFPNPLRWVHPQLLQQQSKRSVSATSMQLLNGGRPGIRFLFAFA